MGGPIDSIGFALLFLETARWRRWVATWLLQITTFPNKRAKALPEQDRVQQHPQRHPRIGGALVFDQPDWAADYARDHFAILSYDVGSTEQMRKQIKTAVEKKIGRVYVTNGGGANPWNALPKYWDEEVALVRELNHKKKSR